MTKKDKIGWISILTAIVLMAILIPTSEVFTMQMKMYCIITIAMILVFAFELLPNLVAGLLLPSLYVYLGVASGTIAFSPWLSYLPWCIIGGLLLVNTALRTGLLKRIAFQIVIKTGGSYNGVVWGLTLGSVVLTFLVPGAAVIIMVPLAFAMCKSLNLGRGSTAAGLMIAAAFGSTIPCFFVYSPASFGVVLSAAQAAVPELDISYIKYLGDNIIWLLFLLILTLINTKIFKPDVKFEGKDYVQHELDEMGALRKDEKKTLVVIICLIIYLFSSSFTGLSMGWGFVFAAIILFLPGISVATTDDIKNVDWGLILFITACLSIGAVANNIGVSSLMMSVLIPTLQGKSTVILFLMVFVVVFVMNFLMTPAAIASILGGIFATTAVTLGMDPEPLLYVLWSSADQVLLPYEYFNYLFLFSFGIMTMKDFLKAFSVKTVIYAVFLVAVAVPYWMLIGIL